MGHYMPYLGSDGAGLNNYGLPFPVPTIAQAEAAIGAEIFTGAGTPFPFQLPLIDAVRLWWVLAGISADISHQSETVTGSCAPGDAYSYESASYDYTFTGLTAPDERGDELALPLLIEWETAIAFGGALDDSNVTFRSCDGTETPSPIEAGFFWRIGGETLAYQFVPPLMVSATSGYLWVAFQVLDASSGWFSYPSDPLLYSAPFSADLITPWFTETLTLYKRPTDSTLLTNDYAITFTAGAFRPFAVRPTLPDGTPHPNAGLPIYNTTTGATLRDPVTGF